MKHGRIYVDGAAYQGEDLEHEEVREPGLANGFSSHNLGALDALKFGDTPMVIQSEINIKSHLDRILTRVRNKTLEAKRIVIELEDCEL
jgi:hypothetical protein